ncbi:hypothetical protein EIL87_04975 [Saccharopolyspora rhizosphaerae]|uniref:Peptidase inhibitor family I36 protein n=1 Tax=Saccharopolyspora rhizosphaerae TaxID=2492662 RepID=A0A3R8P8T1_9PSEU|nr:peptidase inhibitor family I36 protein [Saccharopolyspora rhizosphaerae]RRO18869.1 hypothetical protein EIL87_04975 [Saccharopolyspora rhizosphaerae]
MSRTTLRSKGFTATVAVAGGLLLAGSSMGLAAAETGTEQDEVTQAMDRACQDGYLCVWSEPGGRGERVDLYVCGPTDLPWAVGSWYNNQFTGTVASFWGPDANGQLVEQYSSEAPELSHDNRGFETTQINPC